MRRRRRGWRLRRRGEAVGPAHAARGTSSEEPARVGPPAAAADLCYPSITGAEGLMRAQEGISTRNMCAEIQEECFNRGAVLGGVTEAS